MVKNQREPKLVTKVREAVDRLAEALDVALRGNGQPEPAYVPVRQPTAEELRRYARRRRGY